MFHFTKYLQIRMQNFSNPFSFTKLGIGQPPQVREQLREVLPTAIPPNSKLIVQPVEEHQAY
jgi:hypothetical protein